MSSRQTAFSALWYPRFREEAHPALRCSVRIDLATGKGQKKDYTGSREAPILHRKETFLLPDDHDSGTYAALTRAEEEAGLYENPRIIGRQRAWSSLLERKGLRIEGHELVGTVEVQRHRTAIVRRDLSRPVQLLISHGLLRDGSSFFDYGCGHGGDVAGLQAIGCQAEGWDPVYRPDTKKKPADVVNLGFVLNVIEDPEERGSTLREAYKLCRRCPCVSVLVGSSSHTGEVRDFSDRVLTSRGTFQKYFRQEEAAALIRETLEADAVALDAGIFVVFREASQQNDFLLDRVRKTDPARRDAVPAVRRADFRSALIKAYRGRHPEDWEKYLEFTGENGRMPAAAESGVYARAAAFGVKAEELRAAALEELDQEELRLVGMERRNSLLVFLAICRFRRIPRMADLSAGARFDILHHFGSYKKALAETERQLFSIGDTTKILELCADAPVGLNSPSGFFFRRKDLPRIDPVLQIFTRVGEFLCGDMENADVIKIHKSLPELQFFRFRDYETSDHPVLLNRTRIDLQSGKVRFYGHEDGKDPEILIGKRLLEDNSAAAATPEDRMVLDLLSQDRPFGAVLRQSRIREIGRQGVAFVSEMH